MTICFNFVLVSNILKTSGQNFHRRDAENTEEKYKKLCDLCASAVFNISLTTTNLLQFRHNRPDQGPFVDFRSLKGVTST